MRIISVSLSIQERGSIQLTTTSGNWLGGQAVAFAVAAQLPDYPAANASSSATSGTASSETYFSGFNSAGWADIVVNSTYVGGAVRQWGNFSFSRIYDAGHMIPYYQPETAFTVFTRIIDGTDISTGEPINLLNFTSSGPQNATHTNSVPAQPSSTCWIRDLNSTCSTNDVAAIAAGKGIVEAGVWYSASSDYTAPTSSVTAGKPGTPISSATATPKTITSGQSSTTTMVAPVGVYTATATPSSSSGSASGMLEFAENSFLSTIAMALGAFAMWL